MIIVLHGEVRIGTERDERRCLSPRLCGIYVFQDRSSQGRVVAKVKV